MKRYEFSYRGGDNDMHFVVVYDENIISACERVLCRAVVQNEVILSKEPCNAFITGWENTNFTIHIGEVELDSHHVVMPQIKSKIDAVLEGLI